MIGALDGSSSAALTANAILRGLSSPARAQRNSAVSNGTAVDSSLEPRGKSELTEEERREVENLRTRDQEVRRHESAHKASAGGAAKGAPQFEYTTGPDGRRYATGGEVQIDTSEVAGDPRATIAKMQQIRRAAHAPAEPSSQDRRVAAEAAAIEARARSELAAERRTSPDNEEPGGDHALQSALRTAFGAAPSGHFLDVTV